MATRTYRVERSIHVAAPPAAVHERIVDLRRWPAWSPWEGIDPHLRRSYGGPDAGVGAWYAWEGNRKAGVGRMRILDVGEDAVTIALEFEKPFPSSSTTAFSVVPEDGGTRVTWTMTGPLNRAMRMVSVVYPMDRVIGPDFERGLAQLKEDAEAAGPT